MAKQNKSDKNSDEKTLSVAKDRFKLADEAEHDRRQVGDEDMDFRIGNQWPADIKNKRDRAGRPSLTINKIPQFIRNITNDQRQNRPAIKVSPVDDKADIETAKVIQGLIRHFERTSNAEIAYDTAFENAVIRGYGYFRIYTAYCDDKSFNQKIVIDAIRNPKTVYLDPNHKKPDGSDANWGFIVDEISREDFLEKYPDSDLADANWSELSRNSDEWVTKDTAKIADYYYKEFKRVTLVQLNDGSVVEESKLADVLKNALLADPESELAEVNRRKARKTIVHHCKMVDTEILERTIFPGTYIPIIPVYGDILDVDGKVITEGAIRHSKDSQRMYNYTASTEAEALGLISRAPYQGTPKQIEGFEELYRNDATENIGFLPYNAHIENGVALPPPTRNIQEPAVMAVTNARGLASEDMKATTGIYDASLGATSNEKSGRAIERRAAQSQTSNFHFIDNLFRSIRHGGVVMVGIMPEILDTAQVARIIGEDDVEKIVTLNEEFDDNGTPRIYRFDVGTYDVSIETGPSYATKRQEALSSMIDLTRNYPQIVQIAGDLLVKNMDWPGAQEIAERLKKTIPAHVLDDKNGQAQLPPQVQAQLMQMQQLVQLLQGKLAQSEQKNQQKLLEIESNEKIAAAKMETDLIKKGMDIDSKIALQMLMQQMSDLQQWQNQVNAATGFQLQNQSLNGAGLSQAVPQQSFTGTGQQSAVVPQQTNME